MQFVVAVAEERNFSRAALRCNISQPALSRQVAAVESTLGTKLFERHTRSVRITSAGQLFVREARRTLEQSRRTVSLLQALAQRQTRPLVIGLSKLADLPSLNILMERAQRSTPAITTSLHLAYTQQLMLGLQRGDVDLAVLDLPAQQRGIRTHALSTEPLIAAFPERLHSPKQPADRLAELNTLPLVLLSHAIDPGRGAIEQALSLAGTRAFKIHDVTSIPELLDEVVLHGRLGLMRQSATRF